MDKNFRIWGSAFGLIGDLVFSEPFLRYFEKKYPGSYKIFPIEKKVSQCAPLFLNHPLIDKLYILENWENEFGKCDQELMNSCDIVIPRNGNHVPPDWYNHYNCVYETARLGGLHDINEVLTEEEQIPRLHKWFPEYTENFHNNAYSKKFIDENKRKSITIAPFAGYGTEFGLRRSPSTTYWRSIVEEALDMGYLVNHIGFYGEPLLAKNSNYINRTRLSFFVQIRVALQSDLYIGTDSGTSWVVGAWVLL